MVEKKMLRSVIFVLTKASLSGCACIPVPTYACPRDQVYFYGELIPPYIDKLGRGAHFRATDSESTLYQTEAKCYRNEQALGSKVKR